MKTEMTIKEKIHEISKWTMAAGVCIGFTFIEQCWGFGMSMMLVSGLVWLLTNKAFEED